MHATEAESEGLATFGGDIPDSPAHPIVQRIHALDCLLLRMHMLPMQRCAGGTSCERAESNQVETSRGATGFGTAARRFLCWAGREQAEGGYHHETYDA